MSDPHHQQGQPGWPSPYGPPAPGSPQPGYNPHLPPPRPSLTPEELAAFRECGRESFWYRCVPLYVIIISATQYCVNRGLLKPHGKYGALFRNVGEAVLAYVIGKASYQGACREKIMQLPNSPIADAYRRGKPGTAVLQDTAMAGAVPSYGAEVGAPSSGVSVNRSDDYSSNMDFDADSNIQAKGLDDINRPSVDNVQRREDQDTLPHFTTYDELRERNRKEYERRMANAMAPASSQPADPQRLPPGPSPSSSYSSIPTYDRDQVFSPSKVKRNQYGDVIEE